MDVSRKDFLKMMGGGILGMGLLSASCDTKKKAPGQPGTPKLDEEEKRRKEHKDHWNNKSGLEMQENGGDVKVSWSHIDRKEDIDLITKKIEKAEQEMRNHVSRNLFDV